MIDNRYRIIEKLDRLSIEQVQQVEQFIDSLPKRDTDDRLVFASSKLAESSFDRIWNNSEDTKYDV